MERSHGELLEFRVLGPFEVVAAGRPLEIGSLKQRVVLAMLVLRLNQVVGVDALVEELWGEDPPDSAVQTLQSLVSRLRRTLSDAGPGSGAVVLRTREPGYVLEVTPAHLDSCRFENLVAGARDAMIRHEPSMAAAALTEGLGLWRGSALADLSDRGFARAEAVRLDELRLTATEALAESELALGRPHDAYTRLEALVAAYPLREQAWGHLIVALYRLGRQAEALRAYQKIRGLLIEELGVEPTPWLRTLEEQILHHRPELVLTDPAAPAPAPPAVGARRSNLTLPLTPFVGRANELEELAQLVGSARLLTLTGVGGAGKTRLAGELVMRVADTFPDGVCLVELSPLRDPSLLVSEVSVALGLESVGPGTPGTSEESLCDRLQGRRLLLCLDNCEHLVDAVARLTHALLTRCPGISVLTTSREVLGVAGEIVWGVPPLSLPPSDPGGPGDLAGSDAVALFCARASRAGLELTAGNAAAVAQICRRLDGVPLAIELAAARVRLLGVHQLAARLDDRFRLLTGGPRTAVPRHQTLRAAMDWSHQLLPESEQVALRRLSVFPDSFDLAAAEAVVGPGATGPGAGGAGSTVLELLARLVDKSLVSLSGDGGEVRYRHLETVRQYAAEKLAEAGESADTHLRHRDFFLDVASRHGDEHCWEAGGWANRLDSDYPNFRAAIEYSLAATDTDEALRIAGPLWTYWMWSGRGEGYEWLARALDAGGHRPTPARVEGLVGLAALLIVSGGDTAERCSSLLDEALALAIRLDNANGIARSRFILGELARSRGDVASARRHYTAALEWCIGAGARVGAGWCQNNLGWVDLADGDLNGARSHFEQAIETDEDVLRAHGLAALAPLRALAGHGPAAIAMAEDALTTARACSPHGILIMALVRSSETALLVDPPDRYRAERWLRELLGRLRDLGGRRWVADALELAAVLGELDGDPVRSARLYGACDGLRSEFGEPPGGIRPIAGRVTVSRHRVTDTLGAERFRGAYASGGKAPLAEVITDALG